MSQDADFPAGSQSTVYGCVPKIHHCYWKKSNRCSGRRQAPLNTRRCLQESNRSYGRRHTPLHQTTVVLGDGRHHSKYQKCKVKQPLLWATADTTPSSNRCYGRRHAPLKHLRLSKGKHSNRCKGDGRHHSIPEVIHQH